MYGPGRLSRGATLSSRRADSERQGKTDGRPRRPERKKTSEFSLRRPKLIHVVLPLLTLQLVGDNLPPPFSLLKPWTSTTYVTSDTLKLH